MIVIQIIITVIIPAVMIVCGRRLYQNIPEYGSDGFAFKTRMAKLSEDTWTYANRLFASMLFAAGINACIIAVLFMIVAVCLTDVNGWALAGIIALFEAAAVVLPAIATEKLIGMNYDENGQLRKEMKKKRKERK